MTSHHRAPTLAKALACLACSRVLSSIPKANKHFQRSQPLEEGVKLKRLPATTTFGTSGR